VEGWFKHPDDCEIKGIDTRPGYIRSPLKFQAPVLPDSASGRSYYSREPDYFQLLPWPHSTYRWDLDSNYAQHSYDYEPLDGEPPFDNFPEARALLIYGVSDAHQIHNYRDSVGVRVIDPTGWIDTVRVSPDSTNFKVSVMGFGLERVGARVAVKSAGIEVKPQPALQAGVVEFAMQPVPYNEVQFILLGDDGRLDEAKYSWFASPPMIASSAHVVVEQEPTPEVADGSPTVIPDTHDERVTQGQRSSLVEPLDVSMLANSNSVLDFELVKGTRGYIEKVAQQVNRTYDGECFDACAVMFRRLIETLIIEAFEAYQIADNAKQPDGTFKQLSGLIETALDEKAWNLGRTARQELRRLKADGDRSAHDRRYLAQRSDIDNLKRDLRGVVQELVSLAKLK
jgi:hypothetical protein